MAKLFDGKIQGQTSADAALGTQVIELHSDGSVRWTDAGGNQKYLFPSGHLADLMRALFGTGTGKPDNGFFGLS